MNKPVKITNEFGTTSYQLNGVLHRTDGPAIEWADSSKIWYINGKRHRTDGPAVEYVNSTKYWYIEGELHRTDGPAVECSDGHKAWYINGVEITMENYHRFINDYSDLVNQFLVHQVLDE